MNLTQEEIEWLELAIEVNEYKIAVDNDCVWIERLIEDDPCESECVFTFNNYGQEFIVQLLNYIGCNAYCV